MASNYLEQLAAEWFEYRGYFVRRNIRVGPRVGGGHEGELDVVAYDPSTSELLHVETSMDADSWAEREKRCLRKFQTGERYIRALFHGISSKTPIEKIAIFGLGSRKNHKVVGGGTVKLVDEFVADILADLATVSWYKRAVPEQYPIIRTLQVVSEFRGSLFQLQAPRAGNVGS